MSKKKTRKRQAARIMSMWDQWQPLLGLDWWTVTFEAHDTPSDYQTNGGGSHNGVMRINADWRYMIAYVDINIRRVADLSDERLEYSVVHELCHMLVNEMREGGIDHEERVVSQLAKVLVYVRETGRAA